MLNMIQPHKENRRSSSCGGGGGAARNTDWQNIANVFK
jgi:hypothetical protein